MDIDWQATARVAATLIPAAVGLLGLARGPGALRSRLKHDVELLEKIPPETAARETLLTHVNLQLERIAKLESEGSRDWQGTVIAASFSVALAWLTVFLFDQSEWWWRALSALTALCALATLTILFEGIQRVPRDEKGNKL